MEIKIIHSHSHKIMTEFATAIISGGPACQPLTVD